MIFYATTVVNKDELYTLTVMVTGSYSFIGRSEATQNWEGSITIPYRRLALLRAKPRTVLNRMWQRHMPIT